MSSWTRTYEVRGDDVGRFTVSDLMDTLGNGWAANAQVLVNGKPFVLEYTHVADHPEKCVLNLKEKGA